MAIDDSTNYTLTGAQVKDLAARIKAGGSGMIVYVDASFESPSSITNVFSDSGLTTVADWEDMADAILAGGTVIAVYDNGSNKHQYVELVSVTVNDNIPFGKRFAGVISSNVGEGSKPLTIFLYYDDGIATPRWFAEGSSLPTVNDATLTIQHNGTNVQTFTANQSTNATANVETIYADPIASSAAITPLVQTSMIADGAVTSDKLGASSVTPAKIDWPEFPKFNAYYNTSYNGFPADTPIPFNAQQINVGGFTLSNGRITIPKTGNYMITVQLWVHNNNGRSWWKLRRNGLTINEAIFEATGYWGLTAISCAYVCSQGDIIDVIKNGSESVNLNSGSGDKRSTSITIQYIG